MTRNKKLKQFLNYVQKKLRTARFDFCSLSCSKRLICVKALNFAVLNEISFSFVPSVYTEKLVKLMSLEIEADVVKILYHLDAGGFLKKVLRVYGAFRYHSVIQLLFIVTPRIRTSREKPAD